MLRIVVLLLLSSVAAAMENAIDDKLSGISSELVVSDNVLGEFRQEKYLSFVATPFVSTGNFCLAPESGLFWHVMHPLESTMIVKGETVFLDGERIDDRGIGRVISTVMLGFMEGKLSGLTSIFEVSVEEADSGWSVSLRPKSNRLRAAIELVRIQGENYLSSIEIVDSERNRTLMQFINVRSDQEGAMPCEELP